MRLLILLYLLPLLLPAQQLAWRVSLDSSSIYSSPRLVDLNGDQIQDVVIGAGAEQAAHPVGILAINGKTGQLLWQRATRDQIFITALTQVDLNADGTPDIVSGGRDAQLFALDGRNGQVIWEFWPDSLGPAKPQAWYHFYQPQWVPDMDADGVPDLITSNGGDADAIAWDLHRPVGKVLLLSGIDGSLIAMDTLPDGRETYFAPLYREIGQEANLIVGSGGETAPGSLWRIRLADFLADGLSQAQVLVRDTLKGFIAHPSWADLSGDAVPELIIPQFNGKLLIYDLTGDSVLADWHFPGYECYTPPTIAQFVGDTTPDIFVSMALGQWPFYQSYRSVLIDGQTRQLVWSDTTTHYQFAQVNALDWDQDGFDEVLRLRNRDAGWTTVAFEHEMELLDFQSAIQSSLLMGLAGLNLFSTPALADLQDREGLDLIYAYHPTRDRWAGNNAARIERVTFPDKVSRLAWPSYLGGEGNGQFAPLIVSLEHKEQADWALYPNPCENQVFMDKPPARGVIEVYDLQGKLIKSFKAKPRMKVGDLSPGLYLVKLRSGNQLSTQLMMKK